MVGIKNWNEYIDRLGGGVVKVMDPQGDPVYPDSAESAHAHMVALMDTALADDRSAILVTMKPLPDDVIDVRFGMMNLDQHEKGLVMVAFAVVHMHKKSKSDIKDDVSTLARFVGRMLQ